MLNAYYRTRREDGSRHRVRRTRSVGIELRDGRFRSATVFRDGAPREVPARALVAAAGGFRGNLDWLREVWGRDAVDNFIIRGTPSNRGTVLPGSHGAGRQIGGRSGPAHTRSPWTHARRASTEASSPGSTRFLSASSSIATPFASTTRVKTCGRSGMPSGDGRRRAARSDGLFDLRFPGGRARSCRPSIRPFRRAPSLGSRALLPSVDPSTLSGPSRSSTPRCAPGPSTTPCSTIAAPWVSFPRSHWARPLTDPRSSPTLFDRESPSPTSGRRERERSGAHGQRRGRGEPLRRRGDRGGNVLGKGYLAGLGMTIGTVFGRIAGRGGGARGPEGIACYRSSHSPLSPVRSRRRIAPPAENRTESPHAQICSACRYCEGFSAVFRAMKRRLSFARSTSTTSRTSATTAASACTRANTRHPTNSR